MAFMYITILHSLFIVQFDDVDKKNLFLYINKDCVRDEATTMQNKLDAACKLDGFSLCYKGLFSVKRVEGQEELQLHLMAVSTKVLLSC